MFPPAQAASSPEGFLLQASSLYGKLTWKKGKNTLLVNQNVTPNGKILLDLTTGQVGLEPWFGLEGM